MEKEKVLKDNRESSQNPEEKRQALSKTSQGSNGKKEERREVHKKDIKDRDKRESAKKLKKKEGTVSMPGVWIYYLLALPFLLVLILGIVFSWGKLKNYSRELEIKRAQLTVLEDWNAGAAELSQKLAVLEKEIEVIDHAFPNESGIVDFVDQFSIATEEAVLRTFRFESDAPKVDESGNNYINFQFELAGNFANLLDFVDKIIHLPYLISLKQVEIKEEENTASFVVVGRIYVAEPFFLQDAGGNDGKKS